MLRTVPRDHKSEGSAGNINGDDAPPASLRVKHSPNFHRLPSLRDASAAPEPDGPCAYGAPGSNLLLRAYIIPVMNASCPRYPPSAESTSAYFVVAFVSAVVAADPDAQTVVLALAPTLYSTSLTRRPRSISTRTPRNLSAIRIIARVVCVRFSPGTHSRRMGMGELRATG
jgi:hypothetical protein